MSAQKGKPQPADLDRSQLGFNDTVQVLVPPWRDERSGHEGTVKRVQLDGGDLLVTVEFADGTRAEYWEHEVRRTGFAERKAQPLHGKWI